MADQQFKREGCLGIDEIFEQLVEVAAVVSRDGDHAADLGKVIAAGLFAVTGIAHQQQLVFAVRIEPGSFERDANAIGICCRMARDPGDIDIRFAKPGEAFNKCGRCRSRIFECKTPVLRIEIDQHCREIGEARRAFFAQSRWVEQDRRLWRSGLRRALDLLARIADQFGIGVAFNQRVWCGRWSGLLDGFGNGGSGEF